MRYLHRMKLSRALLLLAVTLSIYCTCLAQDTVRWTPDRPLQWADFQGQPDPTNIHKAYSFGKMTYSYRYKGTTLSTEVACTFDKLKSWTRTTDSAVLAHEQDHFDINEIYARRLRKAYQDYRFNPPTVKGDLADIYSKLSSELRQMQEQYDGQSDHGRLVDIQHEWDKKIKTELVELEPYGK